LAVTNEASDDVSVFLGKGNGNFHAAVNYTAGDAPRSVAVGDLDGDGALDLAVANWLSDNVSVLLGNGDGTFQEALYFSTGSRPNSVAVADLDGDNVLDLALTSVSGDSLSVLINQMECWDSDSDGYFVCTHSQHDCDDSNPSIHPGLPEGPVGHLTCGDGLDNDCDGTSDDSDPGCMPCTDNDGDGYGSPLSEHCLQPGLDCDDSAPLVNPGADEDCNGIDDDCNGGVDEEPYATASCDNGAFCDGEETCDQGACQDGTLPCQDDGFFCNGGHTCDEAQDHCQFDGLPCDDSNDCTEDLCDEAQDTCENPCLAVDNTDPCCEDPECADDPVCNPAWEADVPSSTTPMEKTFNGRSVMIGCFLMLVLPLGAVLLLRRRKKPTG